MSEVTSVHSFPRPDLLGPGGQTSPELTRQAASRGGKALPPLSSFTPTVNERRSPEQPQKPEALVEAVAQVDSYLQATRRELRFSIDEELGETIVRVLDPETDEVIRQIPNEVFLKLARSLQVEQPVHFFNEQA